MTVEFPMMIHVSEKIDQVLWQKVRHTGEGSCFCTIFTPLFVIILMIKFAEIRITHISILHNTFSAKFIVWSVTDDTDASYYYNIIT